MMVFIYRCLTELIGFLFPLAGIFVRQGKTAEFIKGRLRGIPAGSLPKNGYRYWFHCASLGEFEQARPLIERIKAERTSNSIVITFFSPSGYRQKFDYELADAVLYLPLDTPSNAYKLQNYLQADTAVFVKYELWYFHLKELHKRGIPVFLVSAVFREKQFLFTFSGKWLFGLLKAYKHIFVQDANSLELLKKKGIGNVTISGDTRFDRVKQNALNVKINERISLFKSNKKLLVLGSSWQPEEDILAELLESNRLTDIKVMIAPHDISEMHIEALLKKFSVWSATRYTGNEDIRNHRVLILDTIGHLASAYVYSDIALIGGGFGKGLHNILEALAFGVPVCFGPGVEKYPEAAWAREAGVAAVINNSEELAVLVRKWLGEEHETMKVKCTDFIHCHAGASEKILKSLL